MENAQSLMTIISANFVVWKISNEFRSRYFDIQTVPDSMVHSVLQDSSPKIKFGIRDLLCDGTTPFSPAEPGFLYLRVDTAFGSQVRVLLVSLYVFQKLLVDFIKCGAYCICILLFLVTVVDQNQFMIYRRFETRLHRIMSSV